MTDHRPQKQQSPTANTSQSRRPAEQSPASTADRTYICNFCQRSFKRSDTRRLHYGRCPSRISAGKNIPPAAQKGRKPRACDPCAQRKRACDEETPCSQCVRRNIPCTRNRADSSKTANVIDGLVAKRPGPSRPLRPGEASGSGSSSQAPDSLGNSAEEISDAIPQDPFGYMGPDDVDATWFNSSTPANFGTQNYGLVPWTSPRPAARNPPSFSIPRPLRPTIAQPRPSPLTFLFNFTTTTGMATTFNFAYLHSKHKSKRRLLPKSTASSSESSAGSQTGLDFSEHLNQSSLESGSTLDFNSVVNDVPFGSTLIVPNSLDSVPIDSTFQYPDLPSAGAEQIGSSKGKNPSREHGNSPGETGIVDFLADPLFPRTREILLAFQAITPDRHFSGSTPEMVSPATSMMQTQATRCLHFFSPPNLRRFVNFFFDDWYPHTPFIHRPTFDIYSAPVTLVMTMALIGAVLSPSPKDNEAATEWLDWGEEVAFREATAKQRASDLIPSNDRKMEKPVALQAVLLVTILQNWEGGTEAKTRVRRQRYGTLVDLARRLGFDKATHDGGKVWETDRVFDWSNFIIVEELIRTFAYIFLVDSSFVIFNNSPAKVLLQELSFDLACPAACFNAETPELCLFELQRLCPAGSLRTRLSVIDTLQILYQNTFNEETSATFLGLDTLNLFTLISAIYVTISQQSSSVFGPGSVQSLLTSIHNSIATWCLLWNARSDLTTLQSQETAAEVESWKRIGFFQHADEFRVLSEGVLQYLQTGLQREGRRFGRPLPKFDETSMEQVARLLCSLQL